ncbi:unnamed protein product [Adineta steineri]|uniref:G-protein coupled receptors family 1 profile domain-containing protein n=1 Tax=Adineta steineri TaxID=433720 RepID=A0A819Q914_9BILA|nr:unnamed protein product [Adineta steineri]CAF4024918.1 unnamed protein product [Adineta steineri]
MSNASSNSNVLTARTVLTYAGTSVNEIPLIGRFWMFLISNCASLICSIFVLYYLLFDKKLRWRLNNHAFIVGLIINLFALVLDVPLLLYYLYNGNVWIQVPFICRLWRYIDAATYTVLPKLVAWASFERHILIFNERRFLRSKNRILFHYIPIGVWRYIIGITNFGSQYYVYGSFLSYYVNFLFPFGCVGTIPKLKIKIKKILLCWKIKSNAVAPRTVKNQQQPIGQKPIKANTAL